MSPRIVVNGATGRMGRALAELTSDRSDLSMVGGIALESVPADEAQQIGYPRIVDVADAPELIAQADVVIDFSAPEALNAMLDGCADAIAGRSLIVGTTGLDVSTAASLTRASERAAVLQAANFSIGVNLLLGLVEQAARALPAAGYDIEVIEAHHRRKVDAPSGTALALAEAAAAARGVKLEAVRQDGRSGRPGERPSGEIGIHAVRGGDLVGEHRVLFLGALERIEIAHAAAGRVLFAEGALVAAQWLAGKAPGRYTMQQVLGLR